MGPLPYANLRMEHWNPGATRPLTLPIHVICNTSDEQIYGNIRTNSHAQRNWVKEEAPHPTVAVICGSGPSIADDLAEIHEWQERGAKIFALNGCAAYLNKHGIFPDYQVILDARPETSQLVGPAKQHLFASQVAPELFEKVATAQLWQLQVTGIDDLLPEYDDAYVLIGGAASVGNTTVCLAYAMGYRNLQLYGYDSCHKDGNGHAFHQQMNEGDPCAVVKFRGKEYTTSLTMKLQAEKFQTTAQALSDLGCTIRVHGYGLLPDIFNSTNSSEHLERAKYEAMWQVPAYRTHAPGEELVVRAIEVMGMKSGRVIDFGVGTGRAANKFKQHGFFVIGVDIAENCIDEGLLIPLKVACLWDLPEIHGDYGYCTDVMEHIPPDKVDAVITGIMRCVPEAFFQISLVDDVMGSMIGERLHLSVHSYNWWIKTFNRLGFTVEMSEKASDTAVFHIRRKS